MPRTLTDVADLDSAFHWLLRDRPVQYSGPAFNPQEQVMNNEDRTRDQGDREPGTGSDQDGDVRPDPRRTREQDEKPARERNSPRTPDTQRPDQSPRTA
jgi:hypothetical protein